MTKDKILDWALMQDGGVGHVSKAMDEYAKQQAIAFDEWRIQNIWFSFEQGHYYHTFEHGTSMSEMTYNKHYVKTREQLYDQFIESQNK